jgi:hypothetical protein
MAATSQHGSKVNLILKSVTLTLSAHVLAGVLCGYLLLFRLCKGLKVVCGVQLMMVYGEI